jgi:hypothetical protein
VRRWSWVVVVAVAASAYLPPRPLGAQGSPYVPLDDVAYAYVDALVARGWLSALSVLERPYTARQIAAALDAEAPAASGRVVAGWRRALRTSLARYVEVGGAERELRVAATVGAQFTGQSSARRELMLADSVSGGYPGLWTQAFATAGPAVGAWRVVGDGRLKPDPEFAGSKKRKITGRVEDAYVAGQWRLGEIFLGRQGRNWGPSPLVGLQLGPYAYSYDQLYGRLGPDALHLATLLARLDDTGVGPDSLVQRYLALHRVSGRWRRLEAAVAEAVLYGGVGRGFELAYANPLNVFMLAQYNEEKAGNISYGFDLAYRTRSRGIYSGQLLYDDFQIDGCQPDCLEPPSYGVSITAEGVPLAGDQRAFASYTRVSSLAYRTPEPLETYQVFRVGIGRGFSDYDEARLGLDLALVPQATTRVYAAYRRQGEGDYRRPYPSPDQYAATPELLQGVVMRVGRVGLQASGRLGPYLTLGADVGVNRVTNEAHVQGRTRTLFEGRLGIALQPRRPLALRVPAASSHIPSAGP